MSAAVVYKLSEILASPQLQEQFKDIKEAREWNHSTVQCDQFPNGYSTIYIKLPSSSSEEIHCIGLVYKSHHMSGSTLVYNFVSERDGNMIITSKPTFEKLCSQGNILIAKQNLSIKERLYTITATLEHRSRGRRSETKEFSFSPDTKISDVSKTVFMNIFGKGGHYNVISKINNIPCDENTTLKDYEQLLNSADSTFTIVFSDATYGSFSPPKGQYTQQMSGGRTKKSKPTHHKKRTLRRKRHIKKHTMRKTRR